MNDARSRVRGRGTATGAALAALLAVAAAAGCGEEAARRPGPAGIGPARTGQVASPNVVLVVADGFGVGAWSIARAAADSADGFHWLDAPDGLGFLRVECADAPAADAAAAATAWTTGRPARRGGAGPRDPEARAFVRELADAGRAVGIVTTGRITDGAAAAFYGVAAGPDDENELAERLVAVPPEVVLGGGARSFLPRSDGGRRSDGRDLLAEAESSGVAVLRSFETPLPLGAPVLGLFTRSAFPHELDRNEAPAVEELVVAALARLRATERPWFLLVEEALLEPAMRDHDGPGVAANGRRLARTVAAALREIDLDRTLVVLASAGAAGNPALLERARPDSLQVVEASIESMEARIFGGRPWSGAPRSLLAQAGPVLDAGARHTDLDGRDLDRLLAADGPDARRTALGDAVSRRFGIAFLDYDDHRATPGAAGRTLDPVPVRAWGVRAGEVASVRDHAALGKWLRRVLGLPAEGSVDTPGQDR